MKCTSVSMLLLLSLLISQLASCGSGKTTPSETEDAAGNNTAPVQTSDEQKYPDHLPDNLDFGGKPFRVLIFEGGNIERTDGWINYIDVETTTGDVLNDAAYRRNTEAEDRLNIDIQSFDTAGDVTSELNKVISAGEDAYDYAIPFSLDTFTGLIGGNMLYDINDLPHVDLNQPYYTRNSYETYEINGHRYIFAGAYTYPLYSTVSYLFNKPKWAELDLGDPYQRVRDGKWTLDFMNEAIKDTYIDVNGNGKQDFDDFYGFSTTPDMLIYLYPSSGMQGVTLQEDGFHYDYAEEKAHDVMQSIIDLLNNPNAFYDPKEKWLNFFNGNSLILLYGSSLPRLRDIEVDFGLLPMPKYDETQEQYASYMCGGMTCVPATIQNSELVGAAIEALYSASGSYMEDAFIAKFAENKILRDEGSQEMYRMILRDAAYDFTRYISPSPQVRNYALIDTLIRKKSADLASQWAKVEKKVTAKFDEFYGAFSE